MQKRHVQYYQTKPLSTVLYVREGSGLTPEQQAAVDAQVAEQVKGLKAKNEELLGSMKSSKEALQQANQQLEKFKDFDGVDLSKVKTLLSGLDKDEDLQLLADGKRDVLIEKHTARMREAHAGELKAVQDLVKAEAARADAYKSRVLDAQILSVTQGLHKGAVEDALLAARNIFQLDAKGNAVKLDAEGKPELGKDGKTPYNPAEWIETQREAKPHWFPAAASGSGAGGNSGTQGNGKTMKRSTFDAMNTKDQHSYIKGGGTLTD